MWLQHNAVQHLYPPLFSLFKNSKNIQLSFSTSNNDTQKGFGI
jgi:hypothetical protein